MTLVCPHPDPSGPTVINGTDPRLADVWRVIAELRLRKRNGRVVNPPAWCRTVIRNARRDQWEQAVDVCARYPDLTVVELARVLDGDVEPLRYARRFEP